MQAGALEGGRGEEVVQETRLFDEGRGVTYSMRRKEGLADYRYFPEPDLLPLHVSDAYLAELRVGLIPQPGLVLQPMGLKAAVSNAAGDCLRQWGTAGVVSTGTL